MSLIFYVPAFMIGWYGAACVRDLIKGVPIFPKEKPHDRDHQA